MKLKYKMPPKTSKRSKSGVVIHKIPKKIVITICIKFT